jgi:SOS-response transcriptional repressor LexA
MGRIAGDPLCWYFWDRAGLRIADVERVLACADTRGGGTSAGAKHDNAVHAEVNRATADLQADFVTIPFFPIAAATPGTEADRGADIELSQPESLLAAPAAWCPHPRMTFCVRVKGDSMSPLILNGYIIAVDTCEIDSDKLLGEIVVARHINHGLLVSRLIRFGHMDVLVSNNRQYDPVSINNKSDWKLVGKVLWWTGRAP